MLTWSQGLKVAAGIVERTDEEIIEGEGDAEKHIVTIKGEAWDAIRDIPGINYRLLALAEESSDAVRKFLGQLALWLPGYDPTAPPDTIA